MGDVVEEHQPGTNRPFEIEDGKRRRGLVQAISIAASVEAKEAGDDEANGGLVRDDEHVPAGMGGDDLAQDGQGACHHLHAGFTRFSPD